MTGEFVEQPMATFTSLPWVIFGVSILSNSISRARTFIPDSRQSPLLYDPFYQWFAGFVFIGMGMSSVACHASFTRIGFFLDFAAIPTMINFTAAYCFSTLGPTHVNRTKMALYCLGFSIPQAFLIWYFIDSVKYAMMGISAASLVLQFGIRLRRGYQGRPVFLFLAILFLILGVPIFSLDLLRPYCWPVHFIHSHTVWHIFAMLSTYFTFEYFKSEKLGP